MFLMISTVSSFPEPSRVWTLPLATRAEVIKKLVLHTLAELVVSLTLGLAVCAFAVAPFILIKAMFIQCAVSFVFRCIGVAAAQKAQETNSPTYRRIAHIASILSPWSFTFITGMNTSTLIHETGHALAAKAVYQNAHPSIEVFPFFGGITRFHGDKLSRFGQKLGENKSIGLVTAAGPLLSLSVSLSALTTSLLIKKKYPNASRYLLATSISDFFFHGAYALSALRTPRTELAHDFVRLATLGIHPIAATAAIAAAPILVTLGVTALHHKS